MVVEAQQLKSSLQLGVYAYLTAWGEVKILSRGNSVPKRECIVWTSIWKSDHIPLASVSIRGRNGGRPPVAGTRTHPQSTISAAHVTLGGEESCHRFSSMSGPTQTPCGHIVLRGTPEEESSVHHGGEDYWASPGPCGTGKVALVVGGCISAQSHLLPPPDIHPEQ